MSEEKKESVSVPADAVMAFVAILFIIPSVFMWGWVGAKVWGWYAPAIVPGIVLLTWKQVAMLRMMLFLLLPQFPYKKSTEPFSKQIASLLATTFSVPLVMLFVAWLISLVTL